MAAIDPSPEASSWAAAVGALFRNREGDTAIQFGIIAPTLLLFLFGVIEIGRMLWTMNALHYSVEEAARCASINLVACGSASQIAAFAAARSGGSFAASVFSATTASCGNQVSASLPMRLNIPFSEYSVTLSAQSCYPI